MPLTDQAMAAQGAPMPPQGGAPMPPPGAAPMPPAGGAPMSPPQGGMPPVDPATGMPIDPATGMPIDPNTGMPMDPNMMAQGGMPPQGAPMPPVDPNTGMPMDPNMMAQGGMPPQGAPMPPQGGAPVSTGDMVIDMLLEMGAMIVDPNGQPVPPEMIAQMVQEMNAQTGGMPPQGGTPEGAPASDPNGDAALETLAQLDKNVSVMLDKLDSIRAIVDALRGAGENVEGKKSEGGNPNEMDPELMAFLEEQAMANQASEEMPMDPNMMPQDGAPMDPNMPPPEGMPIDPQQAEQIGLMQAMQAGGY